MQDQAIGGFQCPQIDILDPESRSSLDLGKTPFCNHSYLEQFQQHFGTSLPIILDNQQLYQLVNIAEKIIEPEFKQKIDKYVYLVMYLNNISYYFICKLQSKQRKEIEKSDSPPAKIIKDNNSFKKRQSLSSQSPQPALNNSSDKIEFEICLMLNQAERILEYAANCGKNIDRKLIISVLNNQACFYQKVWELQKSCSYIEATIMNMQQWGQQSNWSEISSSNSITVHSIYSNNPIIIPRGSHSIEEDVILMNMRRDRLPKSEGQFSTQIELNDELQKERLARNYELLLAQNARKQSPLLQNDNQHNLNSSFMRKQKQLLRHMIKLQELSIYYLQYSSLCGQLGHHDRSIQTVKKVISKLKKIILMNKKYYLLMDQCKLNSIITTFALKADEKNSQYYEVSKVNDCVELDNRKIIFGLSEIQDELPEHINQSSIQNYRQAARFYLKQYQTVHEMGSVNESRNLSARKRRQTDKTSKLAELHERLTGIQSRNKVEEPDLQNQMRKIRQQVKAFSISDILKIKSRQYKYQQSQEKSDISKPLNKQPQDQSSRKQDRPLKNKQINSILKYLPSFLFPQQPEQGVSTHLHEPINLQLVSHSFSQDNILLNISESVNPIGYPFLISISLLFSTSYFILATQLRLQAAKQQIKEGERFHSVIYKQSELYHIIAILILVIYVPLDMSYLRDMVASYQNYYVKQLNPIDQMRSNDYENGPNQEKIISYSNISLRNKFDKQCIYKYPKSETKKHKQLIHSIKKVLRNNAPQLKNTHSKQVIPDSRQRQKLKYSARGVISETSFKKQLEKSDRYKSQEFQEYENSEDKFYENLFDIDKRNKLQAKTQSKQLSKEKRLCSKSSNETQRMQRESCSPKNGNIQNKEIGSIEKQSDKKIKKMLITSSKTIKLSISNKKRKKKGYNQASQGQTEDFPHQLGMRNNYQNEHEIIKKRLKNKEESANKKATYYKDMYSSSHSITLVPEKKNVDRHHKTGKNSMLENKESGLNIEKSKDKKHRKNRNSSKQLHFRNVKISQYKINTQRVRKSNGKCNTYTYNSKYGSKQKNASKSKSLSQDRIKKKSRNQNAIHSQKKIQNEFKNRKIIPNEMKRESENQHEQKEEQSDPDVYRINVNHKKRKQMELKNKVKKCIKKEKRTNNRAGSPASNFQMSQNNKILHIKKDQFRIAGTTLSNLTTNPNSVGIKSPPGRKIIN